MKYGYARVSTEEQNPALQLSALKRAKCQKVLKDDVREPPPSALPCSVASRRCRTATRSLSGNLTGWPAACATF